MNLRVLILTGLLATCLACGGSEQPAPDPSGSGTPVATPTAGTDGNDSSGTTGGSANTSTGNGSKVAANGPGGRKTVIGNRIKSKPMNVETGKDRLFQNGPTEEEIRRFRARQKQKMAGRLTKGRGGHSQPVFDDDVEKIPGS